MRTSLFSSAVGWRVVRLLGAAILPILFMSCGGGGPDERAVVPASVTTITVSAADAGMSVGQTRQVTAEARDQNGALMTGVAFTWASSNSRVASVSGGVATGHSAGTAGITASSGGVTSQPLTVTVTAVAPAQGSRVVVDKASVFLPAAGRTARLSAQLVDPQGVGFPADVVWISSAPDKVSVDAGGQLVALAIGSAQVFAQVGAVRSSPTLVFVAEPQPGATLVTDAQVVAVGPFIGVAAGAAPGVGSHYEVTLTGVAAPLPGSVVLAAETAPIVGTVVATRQEAAGLTVTLALAPLYQVFKAYDIALNIDLSAFAFEAVALRSARATPAAKSTNLAARWTTERESRQGRAHALASAVPDELAPFKAFDCDPSFKPQIIAAPISLTLDNKLNLVLLDRPGYSKHALEGSANIVGSAGITLKAGFKFGGRCDAQAQLKLPVFGWFSALVMPAVRFGLGAEVEAEVLLVQGELGVTGSIGVSPVLGWECGGAALACRSLNTFKPEDKFETKSKFPTEADSLMQAKLSGHFFVVAGLDAAILLGAFNAGIVEARVGPKQSFDLAFEKDQAARADYASSYDLKFEGVIEPGPALAKAIEKVIGDDSTSVKFKAEAMKDISESPKGSLTVSKSKVRLGEAVDFTVSFAPPGSVEYWVIGYNVTGVELYRRAEGEVDFTRWKSMQMIGSHAASYHWVPAPADGGKYEFAAFVNTEVLTPLLEIDKHTVHSVEVSCFAASTPSSSGTARARPLAANSKRSSTTVLAATCADTWVGTTATGNGAYGPNLTQATVTLKVAPWIDTGSPTIVAYYAEGTVKVKHTEAAGCTTTPTEFAFGSETGREGGNGLESNQWFIDYSTSPPTVGGGGQVGVTLTTVCPTHTSIWWTAVSFGHVPAGTPLSADALGFSGSNQPFYAFEFKRP
jgi:hypothetical protein